ncbi:MAG TPA: phospholipid carrier-dependent glycosyltransferase, partial [Candidatus Limnocylindrales bacterium]
MIGAFSAAAVGVALFLIAAAVVLWVVARRPDRITMLVSLAVLSLAFFILPTRVHERYLFPFAAIAAILAAVSLRWRLAYVLSAAATFANLYVVLVNYYDNPKIDDWIGAGDLFASPWGVAVAAIAQTLVFAWAFFQLREEAVEGVEEGVALSGRERAPGLPGWFGRAAPDADIDIDDVPDDRLDRPLAPAPLGAPPLAPPPRALPGWASSLTRPAPSVAFAGVAAGMAPAAAQRVVADPVVLPAWDLDRDAGTLGPIAWLKARLGDTPARADRSRVLNSERGGRLDRLDVWMLAVLAVSLLTVRMWRLDEPYQMHFDEIYHPRTATEFLQDWRYGISHDIYEWTHPHLAKYAMALGLVAFGEDKVGATGRLGVAVVDAVIETRRDDRLDNTEIEGDRLWVATGSEVRAYDLGTRELAGALSVPDAVALAYDDGSRALYVGTRAGEIRVVDVGLLDATRRGPPVEVESRAFMSIDGPISKLFLTRDGDRLVATLQPGFGTDDPQSSTLVVIDTQAALELGRPVLPGVTQLATGYSDDRIAVATATGVAFIEKVAGGVTQTLDLGGPVGGIVGINDIEDDPIIATVQTADGPKVGLIIAKTGEDARLERTYPLPGRRAGRAYFDLAARMVHVEGSVPETAGGGFGLSGPPGADTIYVIEPHGSTVGKPDMIYADAPLPFVPAVIVMDDNQKYPSSDRQQLLAFDAGGSVASVEIGRHAYAWRVPGVIAGVLMAMFLYVLARLLFKRRDVAVLLGVIVLLDGMLFAQSRIGMNDSYVGLGIVGAYTIFAALWLKPGNSRRHWIAFALGVPLIGAFLGFALASK